MAAKKEQAIVATIVDTGSSDSYEVQGFAEHMPAAVSKNIAVVEQYFDYCDKFRNTAAHAMADHLIQQELLELPKDDVFCVSASYETNHSTEEVWVDISASEDDGYKANVHASSRHNIAEDISSGLSDVADTLQEFVDKLASDAAAVEVTGEEDDE